MLTLLRESREDDLWRMCCGFIDLAIADFMAIQDRLLREQIGLLARCRLGRRLFGRSVPGCVAEFRERVPFTSYTDYCPDLLEKREDTLPARPVLWQHTSGRTGEYRYKWIPVTSEFAYRLARTLLGVAILAASHERSNITQLREKPRMVYAVAPRPYTTGTLVHLLNEAFPLRCLPPLEEAEKMTFEERLRYGFRAALSEGLDGFGGLSLALLAVGEQFASRSSSIPLTEVLARPSVIPRLLAAWARSTVARRSILPRDVWSVKAIIGGGADSAVLRERIQEYWGRYPLDTYTSTEAGIVATQTWDYRGMTFIPDLNYLEFIPEAEGARPVAERGHVLRSVTLDGVEPGEVYELAVTNFHGGAMVRYRTGDLVRIVSLRNKELDIDLPQMIFERRADDLIDLAGFVRLTERTIWQAIENTGIPYRDWTATKSVAGKPLLTIHLEIKQTDAVEEEVIEQAIYREMERLDERVNASAIYETLAGMVGRIPIEVHLLPQGAFASYMRMRQQLGADLAHLKPPHLNPSPEILAALHSVEVRA